MGGLLLIERASKFLKRPKVEMVKCESETVFFCDVMPEIFEAKPMQDL